MNNREKLQKIRAHKALIEMLYSKKYSNYDKSNIEQERYFCQCRTVATKRIFN